MQRRTGDFAGGQCTNFIVTQCLLEFLHDDDAQLPEFRRADLLRYLFPFPFVGFENRLHRALLRLPRGTFLRPYGGLGLIF